MCYKVSCKTGKIIRNKHRVYRFGQGNPDINEEEQIDSKCGLAVDQICTEHGNKNDLTLTPSEWRKVLTSKVIAFLNSKEIDILRLNFISRLQQSQIAKILGISQPAIQYILSTVPAKLAWGYYLLEMLPDYVKEVELFCSRLKPNSIDFYRTFLVGLWRCGGNASRCFEFCFPTKQKAIAASYKLTLLRLLNKFPNQYPCIQSIFTPPCKIAIDKF